ncbi:MAG TPA: type II toxin-antitoxin system VapB family antitoxin [Candidatus Sulfotelmatobacter sp.]|nr:type II toxin-antitoxin system VapB family antitoxin [Candidatus Sulfotelmatobacter sp.]
MSLNIKNEETHRMAKELARLTGESVTLAVGEAVRERLERIRKDSRQGLAEKWMKIARDSAPMWKEPFRSTDHGELLYDEKGLPK